MYVCICQAITERQVREAVQQGMHTVRALKDELGVAAECGKCARCAQGIIRECRQCPEGQGAEACAA